MPAGWVAAAVGAATSIYGAMETGKAAKGAAKGQQEASETAIARSGEAFESAERALTPYARQEQAASTQMMAQMGLAPPGGGGGGGAGDAVMGTGGGDAWGFGADPRGTQGERQFADLMTQILGQNIADSFRTGWHRSDGLVEGARRTEEMLKEMQASGQIPDGYTIPSAQELVGQSQQMYRDVGGNYDAINEQYGAEGGITATHGAEGAQTALGQFNLQPGAGDGMGQVQAGGPGGMMGQGALIDGATGEVIPDGGGGGPQVQNIQSIMQRAGADQLPPEIREQYMRDLMGTTVGNEYQETGAYQAAREAGIETVQQGAASSGQLYSGARGEALRDVGQDVEQRYYQMAQQQANLEAARRGGAYETGQQRGQSYYNNYMQMLSGMSDPRTTTNIEQMRQGAARAEGATVMGTARDIGQLEVGTAGAYQAAGADVAGGMMKMGEAWIGREQ